LLGLLGKLDPFMFLLMSWVSQQFIQLVLLPIIMVGQNTLNHQQEVIAEEQYTTTVRLLERLEAQDEVLEASAQDIHAHIETLAAQNAELLRLIHISLKGNLYEQRGQISQSGLPVWESDDWDLSRNVHR
jgi:hypothetical protein